ncbi:unnamed protein product [Moneuplotes crassus]|uniref:Uncharacterized protein n=1 Tax=Euplotes crassus TaxID=5936 RepID=A0AAD2D3G9_EUPCR|nr:unnamed protein product [Moneuplotes crassus]
MDSPAETKIWKAEKDLFRNKILSRGDHVEYCQREGIMASKLFSDIIYKNTFRVMRRDEILRISLFLINWKRKRLLNEVFENIRRVEIRTFYLACTENTKIQIRYWNHMSKIFQSGLQVVLLYGIKLGKKQYLTVFQSTTMSKMVLRMCHFAFDSSKIDKIPPPCVLQKLYLTHYSSDTKIPLYYQTLKPLEEACGKSLRIVSITPGSTDKTFYEGPLFLLKNFENTDFIFD